MDVVKHTCFASSKISYGPCDHVDNQLRLFCLLRLGLFCICAIEQRLRVRGCTATTSLDLYWRPLSPPGGWLSKEAVQAENCLAAQTSAR